MHQPDSLLFGNGLIMVGSSQVGCAAAAAASKKPVHLGTGPGPPPLLLKPGGIIHQVSLMMLFMALQTIPSGSIVVSREGHETWGQLS